jgi:tetratricopeptide (TPR) repeat protein
LRARCVEHFGEGEGYLPLVEALTERCRTAEGRSLIAALRRHAPTWLMQMPAHLSPADREELRREVLGTTRARMVREFCELVEALAEEIPLVLVLEDLHWSDYATIDVLSLLARRTNRARLLVLGSYRPFDVISRTHPVAQVQQELGMRGLCSELRLDLLSLAEVTSYLNLRLGGGTVADELAQLVYRRSDGHPLFLVNLVDYLVGQSMLTDEEGRLTWAPGGTPLDLSIPDSLRHLMQRQLDSLESEEVRCIEAASVAGAQFSAALVANVLNVDVVEVEATCENLARREHWLKSAGITEWPDGTVAGCYSFLHALYVTVLYQRLAPAQCMRYHRSIGERLSAAYGENRREVAAQLALHFEQARDPEKAITCLQLAADHMARRWAFSEALGYLDRAVLLTERLPHRAQTARRTELLLQQAAVRRSLGDIIGAIINLEAMLTSARSIDHRRYEIRALVDLSRAFVWLNQQRCLDYAKRAVELSQTLDDPVMGAMTRANHAGWSLLWGDWREEHIRALEQGLAVARHADNAEVLNSRLTLHALVEGSRSNYRSARALAEEGMTLAESLGDGYQFAMCELALSFALSYLGCWAEVRRLLERSLLLWSKNQNARVACMRWCSLALLSAEAGDFAGGLRQCDEAHALYAEPSDITVYGAERTLRGRVYVGLGRFAEAMRCFAEVTQRIEGEAVLMDSYMLPALHLGLSECWLAQGDPSRAREEARRLCEVAERPPERTYLAHGHRLLAEVAMAEQAWDAANGEINKALEIVNAAEVPLAAWRVHATAAGLLDRQGRSSEATRHRREATEVIDAIAGSLEPTDPWRLSLCARGL